jgi:hypothetical protein
MATAMSKSNALVLAGDLPATPLVVLSGDTIAKVQSLTTDAAAVTALNTPAEANHAGQLLREINGLNRDIEKARVEVVAPFLDFQRRINAAAKTEQAKLDTAEKTLRNRLSFYQVEQERIQREEAERQRKEQERLAAEARRLEQERARIEAERVAAEKAAANAQTPGDDDLADLAADVQSDALADEQANIAAQVTQLAQTRAIVAPKPQGIHYRTTLKHQVTDLTKLPPHLTIVTANDAEIRRLFVTGWKEGDAVPSVPGIQFSIDKQPVVTGRR